MSGWGCSDPSFRYGEPTPEQALKALARSANVTVEYKGEDEDGLHFEAWTDPDNRYQVTYGPGRGGFCKHAAACLVHWAPWHRQLALGAADALEEIKRLEKETRKLRRETEKWKKKCTG